MNNFNGSKSSNVFYEAREKKSGILIPFPVQKQYRPKSNFIEWLDALKSICPTCKAKTAVV